MTMSITCTNVQNNVTPDIFQAVHRFAGNYITLEKLAFLVLFQVLPSHVDTVLMSHIDSEEAFIFMYLHAICPASLGAQ